MFNDQTSPLSVPPLPPIQLAFWATQHEVRRSRRTEESLAQVLVPTHHDSLGYRRLAAERDAAGLLAAWTLLVGIAARLPRPLRGLLVSEAGRPYTCADLAVMTGFPEAFFTRAFAFFGDPTLGWLVSPDVALIPAALATLKENRAAAEAQQRERAARALERRQLRAAQKRAPAAAPTTASSPLPPNPTSPRSIVTPPPAPASSALPSRAVPPSNWREILTAFCPDCDWSHGRPGQHLPWDQLYPELQTRVLLRSRDPSFRLPEKFAPAK